LDPALNSVHSNVRAAETRGRKKQFLANQSDFQSHATVQEGVDFTVENDDRAPAEIVKTRLYFVDDHVAQSQRGNAMIVVYDNQTVTGLHCYPNAESMFVVLDGALQFTVNGEQVVVKPGQAAIFGSNDRHGLRTADGLAGASFLEFHIPAAYTTLKG
jgi:quercetin dioxygenase-like cupin family protein